MSNKIGVLTVAFREANFIAANIRQFDGFELDHIVVCSTTPWHGHYERDRTFDIAAKEGAHVCLHNFSSDAQQRNYGLRQLAMMGCKWTLVVDADEFYTPDNIQTVLDSLDDSYDVVTAPNMSVYWKTPYNLIYPDPQPDNPIVAIKTSGTFSWSRLSDLQKRKSTEAHMHHLSYVRTDKEMLTKMAVSEHSHEIVEGWYNNKWLNWQDGDENLHPVVPGQFSYTRRKPIPSEILNLFRITDIL